MKMQNLYLDSIVGTIQPCYLPSSLDTSKCTNMKFIYGSIYSRTKKSPIFIREFCKEEVNGRYNHLIQVLALHFPSRFRAIGILDLKEACPSSSLSSLSSTTTISDIGNSSVSSPPFCFISTSVSIL